jgi:hypothetical protein
VVKLADSSSSSRGQGPESQPRASWFGALTKMKKGVEKYFNGS